MDRDDGSRSDWQIENALLLRQFVGRSLMALLIVGLPLLLSVPGRRLASGLLSGGGWMVANCLAMVWMGVQALRHSHVRSAGLRLFGCIAVLLGSLALGGWLALVLQPVRVGFAVGLSIPLAIFLLQMRHLQLTLHSHAR